MGNIFSRHKEHVEYLGKIEFRNMNKIKAIDLKTLKLWFPIFPLEMKGMEHISLLTSQVLFRLVECCTRINLFVHEKLKLRLHVWSVFVKPEEQRGELVLFQEVLLSCLCRFVSHLSLFLLANFLHRT